MKELVARSPLRVSFVGGGTDISPFPERYGGAVLNTTIDMGVSVRYINDEYPLELVSRDLLRSYLIGVRDESNLKKLSESLYKYGLHKGKILISGDVPPGSGLGSSSALITAITALGEYASGRKISAAALAAKVYRVEKENLGILLGFQDPYAIAIGGFKFMTFRGAIKYTVERFNKSKDFVNYISSHMLLLYTGGTRESSAVLNSQVKKFERRDNKTTERLLGLKRLAIEARDYARSSDIEGFTKTVNSGWKIKRGLSSGVSNAKIDSLISSGLKNGALSGRLLGGGSDGFVMFIADEGRLESLQRALLHRSGFVVRASISDRRTTVL